VRECFEREGSIQWQRRVEVMDQEDLDKFIENIKREVWKLARNKYGNHLLRTICKEGDQYHREWIL